VTSPRHYAALALAAIPVIAYLSLIAVQMALGKRPPDPAGAVFTQTLLCLANGFVITSVLWAAALTTLIDGQHGRSAVYFLVAAGCSLFGLIHSPLANSPVAIPTPSWMRELPHSANFQTPYQWAIGYLLAAAIVYFWPHTSDDTEGEPKASHKNGEAA
jgi:AGZA family xanthine/uracil permease-like MFS transporter